jgi:hypothetical protein
MAQAVSFRSLTTKGRVRCQVSSCEIYDGRSSKGTGVTASASVFPCHYHSTIVLQPSSYTCCSYQRVNGAKPGNLPKKAMMLRKSESVELKSTFTIININQCRSSGKMSLFSSSFKQNRNVSTNLRKNLRYETALKAVRCESRCSMKTNRRTDRHDEVASRYSQLLCE